MNGWTYGARRLLVGVATATTWATVTLALRWSTRASLETVTAPGPAPLESLVVLTAAALAWLAMSRLALGVVAVVVRTAPGVASSALARGIDAWTPHLSRRLGAALLGAASTTAALGSAPALAAQPAAVVATSPVLSGVAVAAADLDDSTPILTGIDPHYSESGDAGLPVGWTPDRPAAAGPGSSRGPEGAASATGAAAPQVQSRHLGSEQVGSKQVGSKQVGSKQVGSAHADSPHVVVAPGDSLWRIVARHLGSGATHASIAREWPRWYAANRDAIGPDPARILPGQLLRAPGGT